MSRAVKINLDRTFEIVDMKPYPHLCELLGDPNITFDMVWLNGPLAIHPEHVSVAIVVDDLGLYRKLPPNELATSLLSVFRLLDTFLAGPAVVIGSDWEGDDVDVPDWTIELLTAIQKAENEAHRYHQNPEMN